MLTNKIWPSVIYFASRCWDHSTPWWKRDRQVMWKWTKLRFKQVFRRAWRQENWIWSTNKKTNMNPGQTKATFPSCSYSQNAFFYILRENGVKARKQWHSFWRFNAVTLSAVCDKWRDDKFGCDHIGDVYRLWICIWLKSPLSCRLFPVLGWCHDH